MTELPGEHEGVGACPSREPVVSPASPQVVAAGAAGQLVIAPPALEPVLARAAVQPVAAVAPSQPVVTEFAAKLVAAGKAEQPVVAAPAIDLVVQCAARQALGPGAAEKHHTIDRSRLEGAQIRGGIARLVALVPRRGLPRFAPPSAGLNASGFKAIVRVGPPLSASLPARTPSTIATVASKTFLAVVLPISDMPEKTSRADDIAAGQDLRPEDLVGTRIARPVAEHDAVRQVHTVVSVVAAEVQMPPPSAKFPAVLLPLTVLFFTVSRNGVDPAATA